MISGYVRFFSQKSVFSAEISSMNHSSQGFFAISVCPDCCLMRSLEGSEPAQSANEKPQDDQPLLLPQISPRTHG
jgi:hypothetical protein